MGIVISFMNCSRYLTFIRRFVPLQRRMKKGLINKIQNSIEIRYPKINILMLEKEAYLIHLNSLF